MRVVVTRPQPQAAATAARLGERGHEAIILPLTEIVALPVSGIVIREIDYVALTSANALRKADQSLLDQISHLPVFTVGNRTATAARASGFATVTSADGDVEALAALVTERTLTGARVLYLCGRKRRPDFEALLQGDGRKVLAVETYETRALMAGAEVSFALRSADAVLVYAQSAAHALNQIGISGSSATFICISDRVAQALDAPAANICVANHPDEASMLAEIDRLP